MLELVCIDYYITQIFKKTLTKILIKQIRMTRSVTILFCLTRLGRLASSINSSCLVENIMRTPLMSWRIREAQIENMITMSSTCQGAFRLDKTSCFICEKLLAMSAKSRRPVANVFLVEYELNMFEMCVKSGIGRAPVVVDAVANIGCFSVTFSN